MIWRNVSVAISLAVLNGVVFKLFWTIGPRLSPLGLYVGLALFFGIAHAQTAHLGLFASLAPLPAAHRVPISVFLATMVAIQVSWPFAVHLNDGGTFGLAIAVASIGQWCAIQPVLYTLRSLVGRYDVGARPEVPRGWQFGIGQVMLWTAFTAIIVTMAISFSSYTWTVDVGDLTWWVAASICFNTPVSICAISIMLHNRTKWFSWSIVFCIATLLAGLLTWGHIRVLQARGSDIPVGLVVGINVTQFVVLLIVLMCMKSIGCWCWPFVRPSRLAKVADQIRTLR